MDLFIYDTEDVYDTYISTYVNANDKELMEIKWKPRRRIKKIWRNLQRIFVEVSGLLNLFHVEPDNAIVRFSLQKVDTTTTETFED